MESLIKIVYQNGELAKNDSTFLGVSFDTIFTVLTTLGIFILGYIVNRQLELRKEKRRLKELEEYFIKLLELLENPLVRQKDEFLAFSRRLKEKKEKHFELINITPFQVDLIKEIDNKDLYTIFIKTKKGDTSRKTELFGKLRGQIEYFDVVKKTYKESFENFVTRSEQYDRTYKEHIKITSDFFDQMVSESKSKGQNPAQDIFLITLDNIRAKWVAYGVDGKVYQDRYVAREYYLLPSWELCKTHILDPRAAFLTKHLLECIYAFDNLEELKRVYRRHFLIDARGLQKGLFDIKKVVKEFGTM